MIHLAFLLALYFLPTIIASGRNLPARTGVALLNFFFGWTGIGWIAALIWAVTAPTPYYCYHIPPSYPPYPQYPPHWR